MELENKKAFASFATLMSDFDALLEMIESDPKGLEELFREEVKSVIKRSSGQRRTHLELMQVELDRIRVEFEHDPKTCMEKMFALMMAKMGEQNDVLQNGKNSQTYQDMNSQDIEMPDHLLD